MSAGTGPSRPVGVLCLQGGYRAHAAVLEKLGRPWRAVRTPGELAGLAGLILPGGESTAIRRLMGRSGLDKALQAAAEGGLPLFGTCAGLILLAREAADLPAPPLGLLDIRAERNGYGTQRESFRTRLQVRPGILQHNGGKPGGLEALFIRAPRIRAPGTAVEVLARRDQEPVWIRQGRIMAATFHPELTGETALHRVFLELCG